MPQDTTKPFLTTGNAKHVPDTPSVPSDDLYPAGCNVIEVNNILVIPEADANVAVLETNDKFNSSRLLNEMIPSMPPLTANPVVNVKLPPFAGVIIPSSNPGDAVNCTSYPLPDVDVPALSDAVLSSAALRALAAIKKFPI